MRNITIKVKVIMMMGLLFTVLIGKSQEYFNSSVFGDTYYDQVFGTSMDQNENMYVVGQYSGTITIGESTLTYVGGNVDAYLAKYNENGMPLLALGFGNLSDAAAMAVTNDSEGNIYLTGYFKGAGVNSFDADPGPDEYLLSVLSPINSRDAFIIKLTADGVFVWAKQISNPGGMANEDTFTIELDSDNNVYVAGRFVYADFDTDENVSDPIIAEGSNYDGFLLKLDNDGNTIWVKTFRSPDICSVQAIDIDEDNNISVGGYFYNSLKPDPGSDELEFIGFGERDAFFVELNSQGEYINGNYFGGIDNDQVNTIKKNSDGIYIAGFFSDEVDLNPSPENSNIANSEGGSDVFVAKYDQNGEFAFSYTLGSEADYEEAQHISFPTNGKINITGKFANSIDFNTGGGEAVSSSKGEKDHFLIQLNSEGVYQNHVTLGSSADEAQVFTQVNSNNDILMTGNYAGQINLNPFDSEPDIAECSGYYDVYLSRFTFDASVENYTLSLNANPEIGGLVNGAGEYSEGENIEISAIANSGYEFINWTTENGDVISEEANVNIEMPANDYSLYANFEEQSTNQSWEVLETATSYRIYDISFPEGQNEVGYAVTGSGLYSGVGTILKTEDSGDSWTQIYPEDGTSVILRSVYFTSLDVGYVGGNEDTFMKTTDGGLTWENIDISNADDIFHTIEFFDANNGIAVANPVATASSILYVTSDAGSTWTTVSNIGHGVYDIAYSNQDIVIAVGAQNQSISRSNDGGLNWTLVNNGLPTKFLLGVDFAGLYGVAVGTHGDNFVSNDAGLTWEMHLLQDAGNFEGIHVFNSDSTIFGGMNERMFKTNDGGSTWLPEYDGGEQNHFYDIEFTENGTGFAACSNGEILRRQAPEVLEPELVANPNELVFPDTYIGNTSSLNVSLENIGNAALNISEILTTNEVFTVNLTELTILPGESEAIEVSFNPSSQQEFEGQLQIISNNADGLVIIELSGYGENQEPELIVNPSELIFPDTYLGSTSALTINLENIGNAILNISEILTTNDVFTVSSTSLTIEPGENEDLEISFSPNSQQEFEGQLQIISNAVNGLVTVELFGDVITAVDNEVLDEINIYPNPVKGMLFIENAKNSKASIYDLQGNLLQSKQNVSTIEKIDVSHLSTGIYIVKIITDKQTKTEKIEVNN